MRPAVSYCEPWHGTEPATVETLLAERNAAKMGAHLDHNQPAFVARHRPVGVGGGCIGRQIGVAGDLVAQRADVDLLGLGNLRVGAPADDDGLAAPFDRQRHPRLDRRNVDLDGGKGQSGRVRVHLIDDRPGDQRRSNGGNRAGGNVDEVATGRFGMVRRVSTCQNGVPQVDRRGARRQKAPSAATV